MKRQSVRLLDLKPGDRARVTGWAEGVPPARLLEMGVMPGIEIEVVRFAPLGDPLDIRVRGYHLSIRKSEAAQVLVEPVQKP